MKKLVVKKINKIKGKNRLTLKFIFAKIILALTVREA